MPRLATEDDLESLRQDIEGQITEAGGVAGPQGTPGVPGTQIYSGTSNPASNVGINGDYFIRTDTHVLFGPKSGGAWGTGLNLIGPQGAQGTQGAAGANGSTIIPGSGAPPTNIGNLNDYYLDLVAYNFYGPKTNNGWGVGFTFVGPTGTAGATGPTVSVVRLSGGF